jgi:hypothetical protein
MSSVLPTLIGKVTTRSIGYVLQIGDLRDEAEAKIIETKGVVLKRYV